MNPARPHATHVAVRDGRILGAGTLDELAGWGDYRLDERFAGKVLMPGLVEGHSHVMEGSLWAYVYCGFFDRMDPEGAVWPGLKSIDAVVERLREAADALEDPAAPLASSPTPPTACCGPRASCAGPAARWPQSRPSATDGPSRTRPPTPPPASSASAWKTGQTSPPSGGQSAVPDTSDHRLGPGPIAAGKLLPRLREAGWGAASAPAAGGIVPEDCRRIGLSTEDDVEAGKQ